MADTVNSTSCEDSMQITNTPAIWIDADRLHAPAGRIVQMWCVCSRAQADRLAYCRSLLSASELDRVQGMRTASARRSATVARALLRRLLGCTLNCDPRAVELSSGLSGKPVLRENCDLHFNVSHSGEAVLIGLTRAGPIGVDVQQCRPEKPVRDLARRFFAHSEQIFFDSQPPDRHADLFYRMWVLKEAFVKATGEGLARMHTARLTQAPDGQLCFSGHPHDRAVLLPRPLPECCAAAVVLGDPDAVCCWRIDDEHW